MLIHWFRNDLRIQDNPALSYASSLQQPLVGLFILEDTDITAQKVWLHASLQSLQDSLEALRIPLLFAKGSALKVWKNLIKHHSIQQVSWNRRYEPQGVIRDQAIEKWLSRHRIPVKTFNGTLLLEPSELTTKSGGYYKVFTPYYNMHQKVYSISAPLPRLKPQKVCPKITLLKLNELQLIRHPLIEVGFEWEPGEKGAHQRLHHFIAHSMSHYAKSRDYPAQPVHSFLSPHLHFGEISPHLLIRSCSNKIFIRELIFRDFAAYLLYHFPLLERESLKPQFAQWKWNHNPTLWHAWTQGKTGYPIVDAGMRELIATGFMHNRVRMIVASFLVKDLNIAWQKGACWFAKRLLDADAASNSFNWQWSAGTGLDAQPFFRIFNPVLQSKKFDAEGIYIKKWVPELTHLPAHALHAPWMASQDTLDAAGIILGTSYPHPIVDHEEMKKAALKQFSSMLLKS